MAHPCRPLALLAVVSALPLCAVLPVALSGPTQALPGSGPHTVSVQQPLAGVTYRWAVEPGTGTLLAAQDASATFMAGAGPRTVLTCRATHPGTGEAGDATHTVLVLVPVTLHAPDLAGPGQGPFLAWVDQPVPGLVFRWKLEGGQILGPSDQDHLVFRTGTGTKVSLHCTVAKAGLFASQGSHTVALVVDEKLPMAAAGFRLEAPSVAGQGMPGLAARVVDADEANVSYRWSLDGGVLQGATGPVVHWTAGTSAEARVRCVATRLATGAMAVAERSIELVPPLQPPQVDLPERIYAGQTKTARVRNDPGALAYFWSMENLEYQNRPLLGFGTGACQFLAPTTGPASLTCTVRNLFTGEERTWSKAFEVRPSQALAPPARILAFACDPGGTLRTDTKAALLRWDLDRDPEQLVLQEELTGQRWDLPPTARAFPLAGPFRGRQRFSLTTLLRDKDQDEEVAETRRLELVMPGVTVLAGAVDRVGAAYRQEEAPGVTPWSGVTGMAWKAPWLYFSQGDQHTVRRVHLTGGDVEEVAGMRGLPGTGQAGQDRLFEPGQLLHRAFTDPERGPVEDWLVLQPGANCVQAFTEGQVASSMRVLAGTFARVASPSAALKAPSAMAVHAPTGTVFIADRGNRALKLFSPMGDQVRILATGLEATGLAVNDHGDVFYAEAGRHVVSVLRNHQGPGFSYAPPEVFAGAQDQPGTADGVRTGEARLRQPMGLALVTPEDEHLLIADTGNHLVRKVSADLRARGEVETLGARPNDLKAHTGAMAVHGSGIVAMVDPVTSELWIVSADGQSLFTLPGSAGTRAQGLALDPAGNLFLSDAERHEVRVLRLKNPPLGMAPVYADPVVFAAAADLGGLPAGAQAPLGLAIEAKDPRFLLVTDPGNQAVWRLPLDLDRDLEVKNVGKPVLTEPARGEAGYKDGRDGTFSFPRQVCGDAHGRIFVQDQAGNGQAPVLRMLDLAGTVSTVGGNHEDATKRGRGDGPGHVAGFHAPAGIAVDGAGTLYVADSGNRCLRRLDPEGKVTVAAGSRHPASRTDQDNGAAQDARFDDLGALGVDHAGRLLVVEPRTRRLRMVDFTKADAPVTTPQTCLAGEKLAFFPANAPPATAYPFVLAEPLGKDGAFALKVKAFTKEETVEPKVKLQAFCVDRRNRIWVVLQPDPTKPDQIQLYRYACAMPRTDRLWHRSPAGGGPLTLPLDPAGTGRRVDGRPYALCAAPQITAMATDSHDNLFLADAGNGLLWKVDEAMTRISLVAGRYPYLGPVGADLDGPLMGMQGLALTPQDDVVVTCGNAVVKITQRDAPAARPWTKAPFELFSPPVVRRGAARGAADPFALGLMKKGTEEAWRMAMNNAKERHRKAFQELQLAKAARLAADRAYQSAPASRLHKTKADGMAKAVIQAQKALDLRTAEVDAKLSGYAFLLLVDHRYEQKVETALNDLNGPGAAAKAASDAGQARFEVLAQAGNREDAGPSGPKAAEQQARLDYLQAVRASREADAEWLGLLREARAVDRKHRTFDASRLRALEDASRRLRVELQVAEGAAESFEQAHQGTQIRGFAAWTGTGAFPPP